MSVYVDDMYLYPIGRFGRMKMSHLMADTSDELLAMADKIGVDRRWLQHAGEFAGEHFDISMTKRAAAIEHGAVPVTTRDLARWRNAKRALLAKLARPADPVRSKETDGPAPYEPNTEPGGTGRDSGA